MIFLLVLGIERKFSLGNLAHQQLIAWLQFVQQRRQGAFRNQLNKKFHFIFRGRRHNRIGTLDPLAIVFHSQARVLARDKPEVPAAADAEHPQDGSEGHAHGDLFVVELFFKNRYWPGCTHFEMAVKKKLLTPSRELDEILNPLLFGCRIRGPGLCSAVHAPSEHSGRPVELQYPSRKATLWEALFAMQLQEFVRVNFSASQRTSDDASSAASCSSTVRSDRNTSSAAPAFNANFNMPSGVKLAPRCADTNRAKCPGSTAAFCRNLNVTLSRLRSIAFTPTRMHSNLSEA